MADEADCTRSMPLQKIVFLQTLEINLMCKLFNLQTLKFRPTTLAHRSSLGSLPRTTVKEEHRVREDPLGHCHFKNIYQKSEGKIELIFKFF